METTKPILQAEHNVTRATLYMALEVMRVLDHVATPATGADLSDPDSAISSAPFRLYNIGNHMPVELMTFIETLEHALGKNAVKRMLPMQDGDIPATLADTRDLREVVGFEPCILCRKAWPATWHGIFRTTAIARPP